MCKFADFYFFKFKSIFEANATNVIEGFTQELFCILQFINQEI